MSQISEKEALARAIAIVGSSAALARGLGITRAAIPQWTRVPAEHCPGIEGLTNGEVPCEQLRPDVNWSVLRKSRRTRRAA